MKGLAIIYHSLIKIFGSRATMISPTISAFLKLRVRYRSGQQRHVSLENQDTLSFMVIYKLQLSTYGLQELSYFSSR